MNWTGGKLHLHSKNIHNEAAQRQRQHFAQVRNTLRNDDHHTPFRSSVLPSPPDGTSWLPQRPFPSHRDSTSKDDASPAPASSNHDSKRPAPHRPTPCIDDGLTTGRRRERALNPRKRRGSSPPQRENCDGKAGARADDVEMQRQRLLERDDWMGLAPSRPVHMHFPLKRASESKKRHKSTHSVRRHGSAVPWPSAFDAETIDVRVGTAALTAQPTNTSQFVRRPSSPDVMLFDLEAQRPVSRAAGNVEDFGAPAFLRRAESGQEPPANANALHLPALHPASLDYAFGVRGSTEHRTVSPFDFGGEYYAPQDRVALLSEVRDMRYALQLGAASPVPSELGEARCASPPGRDLECSRHVDRELRSAARYDWPDDDTPLKVAPSQRQSRSPMPEAQQMHAQLVHDVSEESTFPHKSNLTSSSLAPNDTPLQPPGCSRDDDRSCPPNEQFWRDVLLVDDSSSGRAACSPPSEQQSVPVTSLMPLPSTSNAISTESTSSPAAQNSPSASLRNIAALAERPRATPPVTSPPSPWFTFIFGSEGSPRQPWHHATSPPAAPSCLTESHFPQSPAPAE